MNMMSAQKQRLVMVGNGMAGMRTIEELLARAPAEVLPIVVAKIASESSFWSWPLATHPRSPPRDASWPSEMSRAVAAKSAPPLSSFALT